MPTIVKVENKAAPTKGTLNGPLTDILNCGLNHLAQPEIRKVTPLFKAPGKASPTGPSPAPLGCRAQPRFIRCQAFPDLHTKAGGGEVLGVWHSLRSEAVNIHPPLCTPAQGLRPPTLGKPHLWDIHVRDGRWGAMAHQRPHKGVPRHCTACDAT